MLVNLRIFYLKHSADQYLELFTKCKVSDIFIIFTNYDLCLLQHVLYQTVINEFIVKRRKYGNVAVEK